MKKLGFVLLGGVVLCVASFLMDKYGDLPDGSAWRPLAFAGTLLFGHWFYLCCGKLFEPKQH